MSTLFPASLRDIPAVLWALLIYVASLAIRMPVDIPLLLLALTLVFELSRSSATTNWRDVFQRSWHMLLFLVSCVLVTVMSRDPMHSIQVQPQLLPALLVYMVITSYVTTPLRFHFVLFSLALSGLIAGGVVAWGVAFLPGDGLIKVQILQNPLIGVPNDILMLSILAPLAMFFWQPGRPLLQGFAASYWLVSLLVMVQIQSRQGLLVLLLATLFFLGLTNPRRIFRAALLAVILVAVIDVILGAQLLHKIYMWTRLYIWAAAWQMFLDSPWVGHGPGSFSRLYATYLLKAGYALEALEDHRVMAWAHSLYLEQLAERGILGLVALVLLLGRSVVLAAENGSRFGAWSAEKAAMLSAVLALVLAGMGDATLGRLWVVYVIFALCAVTSLRCVSLGLPGNAQPATDGQSLG